MALSCLLQTQMTNGSLKKKKKKMEEEDQWVLEEEEDQWVLEEKEEEDQWVLEEEDQWVLEEEEEDQWVLEEEEDQEEEEEEKKRRRRRRRRRKEEEEEDQWVLEEEEEEEKRRRRRRGRRRRRRRRRRRKEEEEDQWVLEEEEEKRRRRRRRRRRGRRRRRRRRRKEEEEEEEEEEGEEGEEEEEIKHYSSSQKILLVGEGDFSFSACLARAFGSASNIVATSLDSTEFLRANYKNAMSNICELRIRGGNVMHGVDATKMACNCLINDSVYDRIIYNFPHAGFFPNESRIMQLKRHRRLVVKFFENAMELIPEDGEIHIAHKSWGFFLEWNLPLLASNVGLQLIEEVPFDLKDYKGYNTKYGFGGDGNFNCNPSKTYKFGFKTRKTAI